MKYRNSPGFTLLELMIVVVVVALLAAIALPSYLDQQRRAKRSAAQQVMMDIATKEEQFRLNNTRAYTTSLSDLGISVPSEVSANYSPVAVTTGGNDCLGTAVVTPAYVIKATATGSQAADGDLCLDNLGNKTPPEKWQR
jgi:type IV pilus assembly protein PilE